MEEEKKTKKELKAEKKAEVAAVKKAKAEEKILKKSEAKEAKKARDEERKKSKLLKNDDTETSNVLPEEQVALRSNNNINRLIIIALMATIPSIIVVVLFITGVIVKDHKVTKIKVKHDEFKLISSNENEVVEFEMSSFFVPLRNGNGIVKLRIALDNLKSDWKKRILMNPGRYRGVVIEAIEEDLVEDIKSQEGQEAILKKIESRFEHLMGNEVFGGIIVREFNVL